MYAVTKLHRRNMVLSSMAQGRQDTSGQWNLNLTRCHTQAGLIFALYDLWSTPCTLHTRHRTDPAGKNTREQHNNRLHLHAYVHRGRGRITQAASTLVCCNCSAVINTWLSSRKKAPSVTRMLVIPVFLTKQAKKMETQYCYLCVIHHNELVCPAHKALPLELTNWYHKQHWSHLDQWQMLG